MIAQRHVEIVVDSGLDISSRLSFSVEVVAVDVLLDKPRLAQAASEERKSGQCSAS